MSDQDEFWARSAGAGGGSRKHHWRGTTPTCGHPLAISSGPGPGRFKNQPHRHPCQWCVQGASPYPRAKANLRQYRNQWTRQEAS